MSTLGDVLVAGPEGPITAAVLRRLRDDGFRALSVTSGRPPDDEGARAPADSPADFAAHALVILPSVPAAGPSRALPLEDFVAGLDAALADMGEFARRVLGARPTEPAGRLVLIADWAVSGLAERTAAAAVSGGLLGLARSWALELAPEGVTANAVVVGPETAASGAEGSGSPAAAPGPAPHDVAHAVAFFLDRRSSGVSGQVLSVCGGRTPGLLPF